MKTCFKCSVTKPLDCFYAHKMMKDGRLNKCIDCTKTDVKKHRQENIDRVRAYDRERANQPHRLALSLMLMRTYRSNNPDKRKAHSAVSYAVRSGKMQKLPCEVCGSSKSVAHHPNYKLPLLVTWLCQPHHSQAHMETDMFKQLLKTAPF